MCIFRAHLLLQFSRFELHSQKVHDHKILNADLWQYRPCFVYYFGVFFRVFSVFLFHCFFVHSWKIHAHEHFGQPFANNRWAWKIHILQYNTKGVKVKYKIYVYYVGATTLHVITLFTKGMMAYKHLVACDALKVLSGENNFDSLCTFFRLLT